MNTLLWIFQIVLAFLYLSGGAYKLSKPDALSKQVRGALSSGAWRALGVIELLGGLLLVVPAALGRMPMLTAHAAALLAVETFFLAVIYARQSVKLVVANPLVWAAVMGVMVAFVAYGRYVLYPLA
jgi:VIT1/CCC1 family predicted Fe2+/Mn2+ transporter